MTEEKKNVEEPRSFLETLTIGVLSSFLLSLTGIWVMSLCGCSKPGQTPAEKTEQAPPPPPTGTQQDQGLQTAQRVAKVLAEKRKSIDDNIASVNKATQIARDETRFAELKVV